MPDDQGERGRGGEIAGEREEPGERSLSRRTHVRFAPNVVVSSNQGGGSEVGRGGRERGAVCKGRGVLEEQRARDVGLGTGSGCRRTGGEGGNEIGRMVANSRQVKSGKSPGGGMGGSYSESIV